MSVKRRTYIWIVAAILVLVFIFVVIPKESLRQKSFLERTNLLKTEVITEDFIAELGDSSAEQAQNVVIISVCDGSSRAEVYSGKGISLSDAWDKAVKNAARKIDNLSSDPLWIRVDVVNKVWLVSAESISNELHSLTSGFDFHGIALDSGFETVITEGELNGRGIYDYKSDEISLFQLNLLLKERGQNPVSELPGMMMAFETCGWICDENDNIYSLCREGADTGRRAVSVLDADYVKGLIDNASSFLVNQVKPDGSFIYGYYPQFDEEINHYNILRHSGTIWSLICRYRMFPGDDLRKTIESAIDYMLSQIRYDDEGAGHLYDAEDGEYKLGGYGIAVVTLTEYMDVFQNDKYKKECIALGEGILKQQNSNTGSYWHIINNNFTRGEDFRTIYYDGECTFALARLYSFTGDQKWLDAACKAVDLFIEEDYTQYRDHWVAYSLNEVTKYVDRKEYYDFALANAVNNYERIMGRARTYPTNLELLMSVFETWQRMVDKGIDTGDFDVEELLNVISARANRQLSGYFYPELAMYMDNPQKILGSFMTRNDKFRVRIDDVQHNIGGYYLYWKNYDAMVKAGLNPGRMDFTLAEED